MGGHGRARLVVCAPGDPAADAVTAEQEVSRQRPVSDGWVLFWIMVAVLALCLLANADSVGSWLHSAPQPAEKQVVPVAAEDGAQRVLALSLRPMAADRADRSRHWEPVKGPGQPGKNEGERAGLTGRDSFASPSSPPRPRSSASWAAGDWGRYPGWVEVVALCVAHRESWSAGLWSAENPVSTASGAFQYVDGTWQAWTDRAGVGQQYQHASDAPPRVQVAVFVYTWAHGGRRAWAWNC